MDPHLQSLVFRQQQIVEMIFALDRSPGGFAQDQGGGLEIYQQNLIFTAARALSSTYPVLEKMLGAETLTSIAARLVNTVPPSTGDWADWGESVGKLLATTPLIESHPYLPDMADLEWKVHQVVRKAVQPVALPSLSRLTEKNLHAVYIRLAPSLQLMRSVFPVDELWFAHQPRDGEFRLDMDALTQAIAQQQGDCLLAIYQQHQMPRLRRVSSSQFQWLSDIESGFSVAELIDRHQQANFIKYFTEAIENNWIERLL